MDWQKSESDSFADGSDGDESIAASPVESVHSRGSYVRSRPQTHNRVYFPPPRSTSYKAGILQETQYEKPPATEDRRRNVHIIVEEESTDSQISGDSYAVPLIHRYRTRSISRRRSRSRIYPRRSRRAPSRPDPTYAPYYSVNSRTSSPSDSPISAPSYSPPLPGVRLEKYTELRSPHTPRKAPSCYSTGKIEAVFADAPDDEHSNVHHIINIRPSHSPHDRDNEPNPKRRSRVFTHQPSFKHEEHLHPETYRIVRARLVPGEDERMHDIAVLTYDEGAARAETEIQWM